MSSQDSIVCPAPHCPASAQCHVPKDARVLTLTSSHTRPKAVDIDLCTKHLPVCLICPLAQWRAQGRYLFLSILLLNDVTGILASVSMGHTTYGYLSQNVCFVTADEG